MNTGHITLPLDCNTHHCDAGPKSIAEKAPRGLRALVEAVSHAWEVRRQRRINRDAFKTLLRMDDRSLADIGVTRDEVVWASRLPLSYNASAELEKLKTR